MSAGRVMVANYFAEASVYDVRKVWRPLKREGVDVARCTVSRLMRDMGLQGVNRGKSVKTTVSDKAAPCPLVPPVQGGKAECSLALRLHLCRDPDRLRLCLVIDCNARRIVGWRASRTARAGFVLDALEQALHDWRPVHRGRLVHHSDRAADTYPSSTLSAWLKLVSSLLSAVSESPTTMLSPKPATVSTRLR